jgi:hypothetical protein
MMRFSVQLVVALLGMLGVFHGSWSSDDVPRLYFVKSIPAALTKKLIEDGYRLPSPKKVVAWDKGTIHHYFLLLKDSAGGCGVANIDGNSGKYNIVDSYGQCKLIGGPKIMDLTGDGTQGIVIKLSLHSNGSSNVNVEQTVAYLYVRESSEFCRNDDAGSFANGTRVPNVVLKFGPSDCR